MEENNTKPSSAAPSPSISAAAAQQQQQLLLQQQLFMMQQHHQNQQQQQRPRPMQQQSQLQQAMSRFPSNIDAHLRAPGLRSNFQFNQNQIQQQQKQLQQQQQRSGAQTPPARNPEVEMALQDAFKVCNPDVKSPFSSIEDAVTRLLPYHVVSDYEAEEDDKILESDKTGQVPSRLQQWDHNILVKIAEFTSTFEKQVLAFNIMTRKRSLGEFRSEERLLLEQALIQEERRAAMEAKLELESREKAARMAAMTNPDLLGGPGPSRTAMRGHLHNDDDRHQPPAWTQTNNNVINSNNEGEGEEEGEDFLNEGEDEEDGEFDLNAR